MNERMYEFWKENVVKCLKRKRKPVYWRELAKEMGVKDTTLFRWLTLLEIRGVVKTVIGSDRKKYIELVRK